MTTHATCPARSLDALAVRAQRAEPGAVDELIDDLLERLRPIISYRVLTRARGALSEVDIDDVVQDIVILIWQHDLPLFDAHRSGFLTFVNRRLQWHLADTARKARVRAGEEADDAELESVVDDGRDPESLLKAHAREVAMMNMSRTIRRAGPDTTAGKVLVEHDLRGARLADVARQLHIHVSNACRARQRGLRHLARHLEALA